MNVDTLLTYIQIGAVGFAAVSVSSKSLTVRQVFNQLISVVLNEGVGPHQWNVSIFDFTSDLLRVRF